MKKHIAFIRPKPWPLANIKVAETLASQFAECDMDIIDIRSLVKARPDILIINTLATLFLYGRDISGKHKPFMEAFWRTPYMIHAVRRLVKKRLTYKKYWFTFQMQSLFDCSIAGTPHFVYTDHTHLANLNYADFDRCKLYPKSWINLEKQIYQNATRVFVRSIDIRQSLIEQYGHLQERVMCVYAGSNINVNISRLQHKTYDKQNILYVGIDWKRKGGPVLVEAFKKVLAELPDATLTIVGAKPEINLPNCHIMGRIPPQELGHYYEDATVFCMPTEVEPFGIVFLEAMQAGLPIVGTRVGAIPDFLLDGQNGYLVEPGDIQGVANVLIRLLKNPEACKQFGEKSLAIINSQYTWEAVGKKFRASILDALSEEQSGQGLSN